MILADRETLVMVLRFLLAQASAANAASAFAMSVLASLLASILFVGTVYAFSRQLQRFALSLYSKLVGIDIEAVFRNASEAADEIEKQLRRSTQLKLLAGRGNDLQSRPYSAALAERPSRRPIIIRLLLPRTSIRSGVDWVDRREKELKSFDPSFETANLLRQQIEQSLLFVKQYIDDGVLELRRYDAPHIGRIAVTDDYVFFTPYHHRRHGRDSAVLQMRRGGVLADSYERIFDELWATEEPPSP